MLHASIWSLFIDMLPAQVYKPEVLLMISILKIKKHHNVALNINHSIFYFFFFSNRKKYCTKWIPAWNKEHNHFWRMSQMCHSECFFWCFSRPVLHANFRDYIGGNITIFNNVVSPETRQTIPILWLQSLAVVSCFAESDSCIHNINQQSSIEIKNTAETKRSA